MLQRRGGDDQVERSATGPPPTRAEVLANASTATGDLDRERQHREPIQRRFMLRQPFRIFAEESLIDLNVGDDADGNAEGALST